MRRLRVLIVEDVAEMGELLAQVVGAIPGVEVQGICTGASDARRSVLRDRPDVILLDEILPGGESSGEVLRDWSADGIAVFLISASVGPDRPAPPPEARGRLAKPSWGAEAEARERFANALAQLSSGSS